MIIPQLDMQLVASGIWTELCWSRISFGTVSMGMRGIFLLILPMLLDWCDCSTCNYVILILLVIKSFCF